MTRISTFGQSHYAIQKMLTVQSNLAEATTQVSSGKKSTSFSGVATDVNLLKVLESEVSRSNSYVDQGELVSSRISSMYDAVGSMIDILTDYQVQLSSAISGGDAETSAVNANAEADLESFVAQANTQLGGRYLFGGAVTDTVPVDMTGYTAQTYPSSASTAYYQGDDQVASYYADDSTKIDYGVTGDSDAFENAIRALSLGANASEDPMDTDALNEAYDLANQAIDSLLTIQSTLSGKATQVDQGIDRQIDLQLYIDSMISDVEDVDLATVVTQQEQYQAQLEASYSLTASISDMSLFKYL